MKKNIKLEFEFDIVPEQKNKVVMRINVDWAITMIKQAITSKNLSDKEKVELLDEYAKYWIMQKAKIKNYPLSK